MDRDGRDARRKAAGRRWNLSRIAARGRRTVPLSRRIRTSALDGLDAEGVQGGVEGVAVRGARILGTPGTQSGVAVCHAEHTRPVAWHGSAVVVLRPQG